MNRKTFVRNAVSLSGIFLVSPFNLFTDDEKYANPGVEGNEGSGYLCAGFIAKRNTRNHKSRGNQKS